MGHQWPSCGPDTAPPASRPEHAHLSPEPEPGAGYARFILLYESAGYLATHAQVCSVDESCGSGWFSDLVIVCGHVGKLISGRLTLTLLAVGAACCPSREPWLPWRIHVPTSPRVGGHGYCSRSKQRPTMSSWGYGMSHFCSSNVRLNQRCQAPELPEPGFCLKTVP